MPSSSAVGVTAALHLAERGLKPLFIESNAVLLTHVITDVQHAFPELKGHLLGQSLQRK